MLERSDLQLETVFAILLLKVRVDTLRSWATTVTWKPSSVSKGNGPIVLNDVRPIPKKFPRSWLSRWKRKGGSECLTISSSSWTCSIVFEPHNLVLELLNQFQRDKRKSAVNVSCTTSASLLNISGAIPKFPSLESLSQLHQWLPLPRIRNWRSSHSCVKFNIQKLQVEFETWKSNVKSRIFHFNVKFKTSMSNSELGC